MKMFWSIYNGLSRCQTEKVIVGNFHILQRKIKNISYPLNVSIQEWPHLLWCVSRIVRQYHHRSCLCDPHYSLIWSHYSKRQAHSEGCLWSTENLDLFKNSI